MLSRRASGILTFFNFFVRAPLVVAASLIVHAFLLIASFLVIETSLVVAAFLVIRPLFIVQAFLVVGSPPIGVLARIAGRAGRSWLALWSRWSLRWSRRTPGKEQSR